MTEEELRALEGRRRRRIHSAEVASVMGGGGLLVLGSWMIMPAAGVLVLGTLLLLMGMRAHR